MYAEHIIKIFRRFRLNHSLRPQQGFFGVLEKYFQRAAPEAFLRHGLRHGQNHGGVGIVPAGMYANLPSVHNMPQGVKVPAHANDRARLFAFEQADDAVSAYVYPLHFVAGLLQFFRQIFRRFFFLPGWLGSSVEAVPYFKHSFLHLSSLLNLKKPATSA
jgi:hypothetical protein